MRCSAESTFKGPPPRIHTPQWDTNQPWHPGHGGTGLPVKREEHEWKKLSRKVRSTSEVAKQFSTNLIPKTFEYWTGKDDAGGLCD